MTASDVAFGQQCWPHQRVQACAESQVRELAQSNAVLWLEGSELDDLDEQIRQVTSGFEHIWVWRSTSREYTAPGYRQGPLLVPLTPPVLAHWLADWAPIGQGVLVAGADSIAQWARHLHGLVDIITPADHPFAFSFADPRRREDWGEGLTPAALSRLIGPATSLCWSAPSAAVHSWWRLDNPTPTQTDAMGALELSVEDEAGLNRARHTSLLRLLAVELATLAPEQVQRLGPQQVREQLSAFLREAASLKLDYEDHAGRYVRLRFLYPQEPFQRDATLRARLTDYALDPALRVLELEERLMQLTEAKR